MLSRLTAAAIIVVATTSFSTTEAHSMSLRVAGLRPATSGLRPEVILHAFIFGKDGLYPQSDLIRDPDAALYGTNSGAI